MEENAHGEGAQAAVVVEVVAVVVVVTEGGRGKRIRRRRSRSRRSSGNNISGTAATVVAGGAVRAGAIGMRGIERGIKHNKWNARRYYWTKVGRRGDGGDVEP